MIIITLSHTINIATLDFSEFGDFYIVRENLSEFPYWISVKKYYKEPLEVAREYFDIGRSNGENHRRVDAIKITKFHKNGRVIEYYRIVLPIEQWHIKTSKIRGIKAGYETAMIQDSEAAITFVNVGQKRGKKKIPTKFERD